MSEADAIRNLGEKFRGRLADMYLDVALDYIDHNESTLAFEFLCAYLIEHDIAITASELEEIKKFSEELVLVK